MSGLVKGVKKVFKAIGTAVKKVMKTTIGKILVGALAIFTGGAALAAFGAMGAASATFGSVMSAALAGGAAPFSAAFSALSGAASSVGSALGLTGGTAGATTAAVGAEGGALATAAAEAAAPGAAAWAAPAAETAGLFGTEAATAAGGMGIEAGSVANGIVPEAATQGASLADMTAAPMQAPSGFTANTAPTTNLPINDFTGVGEKAAGGKGFFTNLWDLVRPETKESRLMYGQILSSVGKSVMQGRAKQAEMDYHERMSHVPDITQSFAPKPGYRWALSGGQ